MSYSGNLLVENRNGLIVNAEVFEANGIAERDAALIMLVQSPVGGSSDCYNEYWGGYVFLLFQVF